jgi:hypothetical protein
LSVLVTLPSSADSHFPSPARGGGQGGGLTMASPHEPG